ncbi:MAG: type II toxin-antitoxin system PemK/MazF family toxin [Candidatus Aenigmarchaeota archaeon]|nr:type II toxin-antitoxin system PemK/MazF family toxin [Candidatus Aenigmarchaeota archaeon]
MEKGEIWIVNLAETSGHEQIGTRPAILISDTQTSICIVIPVTSNLQALRFGYTLTLSPSPANGLSDESVALVFQIRAIDKARLKTRIGKLEPKIMEKIDEILRNLLKLK